MPSATHGFYFKYTEARFPLDIRWATKQGEGLAFQEEGTDHRESQETLFWFTIINHVTLNKPKLASSTTQEEQCHLPVQVNIAAFSGTVPSTWVTATERELSLPIYFQNQRTVKEAW